MIALMSVSLLAFIALVFVWVTWTALCLFRYPRCRLCAAWRKSMRFVLRFLPKPARRRFVEDSPDLKPLGYCEVWGGFKRRVVESPDDPRRHSYLYHCPDCAEPLTEDMSAEQGSPCEVLCRRCWISFGHLPGCDAIPEDVSDLMRIRYPDPRFRARGRREDGVQAPD